MLLAIEAGNTNIKFALIDGDVISMRWRIATDDRKTADEYAVWLMQLFELENINRADVKAIIISTVVPPVLQNLCILSERYFGVTPFIAGKPPTEWGIALKVDEPHAVGADRAINAIAAQSISASEKIVISFGTATTFDHIGSDGAYRGGSIAPGINLSLDALVAATAQLPRIAIEAPASKSVIGRTTQSQMLIGIYWGYVSMVEGMIARMKAEIAQPMIIIATGGLAPLFARHINLFDHIEPDLTLIGLSKLYQNRDKE